MWQDVSKVTLEVCILWRLLFASVYIPDGTPKCWGIISEFGFQPSTQKCSADNAKLLLEDMEFWDNEAFAIDTYHRRRRNHGGNGGSYPHRICSMEALDLAHTALASGRFCPAPIKEDIFLRPCLS